MDSSPFNGDLLVDVLRSDSANLLDLPFLADVFDEFMDEAGALPFSDGLTNGSRLVTTHTTAQPSLKQEAVLNPELVRSSSSGDSSEHTKASGSGTAAAGNGANGAGNGANAAAQVAMANEANAKERDRKKRTRNQQQMEHNRVAQQKYRERKKNENAELQTAVELLTAELAAMKALEVRAQEVQTHNVFLQQQVGLQQQQVQQLEEKVSEQAAKINEQAGQLGTQLGLLTSQQKMILDQHQKLQLQEEIIASLKDRLKESVDRAWDSLEGSSTDPHVVCRKMHEAVREALRDAKDVDGLQETLAALPDHLVVEICKNIMLACKDLFPQLAEKMAKCGEAGKLPVGCATAACTTGPGHVL